jgi:hypothetical protein
MNQVSPKLVPSCAAISFSGEPTNWTTIPNSMTTFQSQIQPNLKITVYNCLQHSLQPNEMTLALPVGLPWPIKYDLREGQVHDALQLYVKLSKYSTTTLHSKKQISMGNEPILKPNIFSNLSQRTRYLWAEASEGGDQYCIAEESRKNRKNYVHLLTKL